MAADTATKRCSAINIGSPWRGVLPIPDGTISQGDRQTVMLMYAGVLATVPVVIPDVSPPTVGNWNLDGRNRKVRRRRGRTVREIIEQDRQAALEQEKAKLLAAELKDIERAKQLVAIDQSSATDVAIAAEAQSQIDKRRQEIITALLLLMLNQ